MKLTQRCRDGVILQYPMTRVLIREGWGHRTRETMAHEMAKAGVGMGYLQARREMDKHLFSQPMGEPSWPTP